jgi:outer membrane protein W
VTLRLGVSIVERLRSGHAFALFLLLLARPVCAQTDVRPFVLFSEERFAAQKSFDATFGSATQPFFGGGVDVTVRRDVFVEFSISRMSKTGQRFFIDDTGNIFELGIASRVSITPVELTGGYRFARRRSRWIPYAAAGVGWYVYRQVDDFSDPSENVHETHAGVVARGGLEVRISRWVSVAGDAQYTHVAGLLGQPGKTSGSQVANENDLGGVAGRFRVILGK